jgi:ABC-type uncharacterized transport system substrate-binding protein
MIKKVSDTLPVVMAGGSINQLVQDRLAASLARPGGAVTGLVFGLGSEEAGKRLQLLKEAVPKASRVAFLAEPPYLKPPTDAPRAFTDATRALKLTLVPVGAAASEALDSAGWHVCGASG